jgi:hypothetical protein
MLGNPADRVLRTGFWLCLALVAAYLVVSAFEPFRTNWGDPWSDGNAMTSGRYFSEEGFVKLAFTPILDVGPVQSDSLRYTHYPPLPDIVAGVVMKVIGPDHLAVHRLLALLFSAIALVLLYRYLEALFDRAIASLSVVAIATNLLFIQYADTVHHIPLYMMTGFGCLLAAVRWLDGKSRRSLLAVAVLTFFCFLASYDYYFLLSIMILATVKFRKARIFRGHGLALILVFGFAGIASIVTKNLLVIWAEGVEHWRQDIVFQFFERATSAHSRQYKEGLRDVVFWRIWRFYSPVFFVALIVQFVAVLDRIRGLRPTISMRPLIFLVAGVPFMLVFTQLVVEQYHPMLLLLPFAGVSIAVLLRFVWASSPKIAAALLALYLGWQAWQLVLFKKTFLEEDDVAAVQKVLEGSHHRLLMSNIFVDGPVRYLWKHHLFGIDANPLSLRAQFDMYGAESPMTIVQLKHMGKHMYDKGVYAYFVGERRWSWISRPDYYRNAWIRRFNEWDRGFDEALEGLGTLRYESKEMRVRTVSLAEVTALQLSQLPAETPTLIDFETVASDAFKMNGFAGRYAASKEVPGHTWLSVRQPSRLVFTLHGHEWIPNGPPNATSELEFRSTAARGLRMNIEMSVTDITHTVRVLVNGHELGRVQLIWNQAPKRGTFDIPASLLRPGGVQTITLEVMWPVVGMRETVRLHRIELQPL